MSYYHIPICFLIAICSIALGEYRRNRALSIFSPEMRKKMVNCNEYLRILKKILVLSALGLQCSIIYGYDLDWVLGGVFLLLAGEQLIPTARWYVH